MNYAFVKTDQCDVRVVADMRKAVVVKGRDLGREENTEIVTGGNVSLGRSLHLGWMMPL